MGNCFLEKSWGFTRKCYRLFGGLEAPQNPRDGDIWIETTELITGYTATTDYLQDLGELEEKGHIVMDGCKNISIPTDIRVEKSLTGATFVLPDRCCQYDGSGWNTLKIRVRRNGNWYAYNSWNGELLDYEKGYNNRTGGWHSTYSERGDMLVKSMFVKSNTISDIIPVRIRTGKQIYIHPGWKKICIEGQAGSIRGEKSSGDGKMVIWKVDENKNAENVFTGTVKNEDSVQEFDISGIEKGLYYIGIEANADDEKGKGNITLKRVWLE